METVTVCNLENRSLLKRLPVGLQLMFLPQSRTMIKNVYGKTPDAQHHHQSRSLAKRQISSQPQPRPYQHQDHRINQAFIHIYSRKSAGQRRHLRYTIARVPLCPSPSSEIDRWYSWLSLQVLWKNLFNINSVYHLCGCFLLPIHAAVSYPILSPTDLSNPTSSDNFPPSTVSSKSIRYNSPVSFSSVYSTRNTEAMMVVTVPQHVFQVFITCASWHKAPLFF